MKRSSVSHLQCSIAQSLEIVGEWWTLLVLRNISMGQRRFEAIQADLGIARNVLSDRLSTLVEHEILEKHKYQDNPERYEYRATAKGKDLMGVLYALMAWGDRWAAPEGKPMILTHTDCGHETDPQVVCSQCGEPLLWGNTSVAAGPGLRRRDG